MSCRVEPLPAAGAGRAWLHHPATPGDGLALFHGAGSTADSPLLTAVAEALCEAGIAVLRCDLPFRAERAKGPPRPGDAARDREGIRIAAEALRPRLAGRLFLGGHSYGGRQATLLASAQPGLADGLLLLSYPLHPPGKPQQLRTQHFPALRAPALFVHGSRDPFGAPEEMREAVGLIPAPAELILLDGLGHDLLQNRKPAAARRIAAEFLRFGGAL